MVEQKLVTTVNELTTGIKGAGSTNHDLGWPWTHSQPASSDTRSLRNSINFNVQTDKSNNKKLRNEKDKKK